MHARNSGMACVHFQPVADRLEWFHAKPPLHLLLVALPEADDVLAAYEVGHFRQPKRSER